ncbi:hypothetical protein PSYMO_27354, partial [Pseudomonas amygdali pv. mori str. 301020]
KIVANNAYWLVEELAMLQARCKMRYAVPYGARCRLILSDVPKLADLSKLKRRSSDR